MIIGICGGTASGKTIFAKQIVKIVGADKILFGSDYPLLAQERLLKEIEAVDLSNYAKRLVLSGNAKRLLGIRNCE